MITLYIFSIIAIEATTSSPFFIEKMVSKQIKENIPKAISLVNLNGMLLVDEIASHIEKSEDLRGREASKKFKDVAYTNLELPGAPIENLTVDNINNFEKTLDEYESNMKKSLGGEKNGKHGKHGKKNDNDGGYNSEKDDGQDFKRDSKSNDDKSTKNEDDSTANDTGDNSEGSNAQESDPKTHQNKMEDKTSGSHHKHKTT